MVKLWVNCSPQEKHLVKDIERKKGWLDFLLIRGYISKKLWKKEKKKLLVELDKIERKYRDDKNWKI